MFTLKLIADNNTGQPAVVILILKIHLIAPEIKKRDEPALHTKIEWQQKFKLFIFSY